MLYFLDVMFLLIYALMYTNFRDAVRVSHKISRRAKLRGWRNFWWFESVREKKHLGYSYLVNKQFTILYAVTAVPTITLGWWELLQPYLALPIVLLSGVLIPMNFYAFIQINKKDRGRVFVLFAWEKDGSRRFYSTIEDIVFSLFPLVEIVLKIPFLLLL